MNMNMNIKKILMYSKMEKYDISSNITNFDKK